MMSKRSYKIFAVSSAQVLGEEISCNLNKPLGSLYCTRFSDGEVFSRFDETIRGETVVLVGQVNMPYNHLFEFFTAADAARRASAGEVLAVLPYLPHSRQERRDGIRTGVISRMVADFIQLSGVDRLITIDLHSPAIEGFYKIPIDHISMSSVFLNDIRDRFDMSHTLLCSPDFGGLKRIRAYKQVLDCEMAVIHKERLKHNQVSSMEIIGSPVDKDVIIVDDLIDTGGTLCKAAEILMDQGARSVTAYCTHGVLSGGARETIEQSPLKELVITNTLPGRESGGKLRVVSCAPILTKALQALLHYQSLEGVNKI
jgi:ribose-phosphate pyrophosphokinase